MEPRIDWVKQLRIVWITALCCCWTCAPASYAADVDLQQFGAVGDGVADDTEAFIKAVATVAESGGGVVRVASGQYVISRPIVLEKVGLAGTSNSWTADDSALPTILPVHAGPAIQLNKGASLYGLAIVYTKSGSAKGETTGVEILNGGVLIENVKIRRADFGIITTGANNGRLNIHNCFLASINRVGLRIAETRDIPTITNVEVWNAGHEAKQDKGVAFEFASNDLARVTNCFAFGHGIGFLIDSQIDGHSTMKIHWGSFSDCSTDQCGRGFVIRESGEAKGHHIVITGGLLNDHQRGIEINAPFTQASVHNVFFQSNGAPDIVVSSADSVVVSGCDLNRWFSISGVPNVVADQCRLVVSGSILHNRDGDGVVLGTHMLGANISGNYFHLLKGRQAIQASDSVKSHFVDSNNVVEFISKNEAEAIDRQRAEQNDRKRQLVEEARKAKAAEKKIKCGTGPKRGGPSIED